jgi:hypothetical protein
MQRNTIGLCLSATNREPGSSHVVRLIRRGELLTETDREPSCSSYP